MRIPSDLGKIARGVGRLARALHVPALHIAPVLALAVGYLSLRAESRGLSGAASVVWGLLIITSMCGWGTVIERLLLSGEEVDWGLRCGWGMAFLSLLGGLLCLLHIAVAPVLIGLVIVGSLLAAGAWVGRRPPAVPSTASVPLSETIVFRLACGAILLLALVNCIGWTVAANGNGNDDSSYAVIIKDIVELGASIQPFSFRRLAAYGGHEFLVALHMAAGAPHSFLYMLDGGVCPIVLLIVIFGASSQTWARVRPLLLLVGAYVLFTPGVRMNIASHGSSLAMVVVLYRTITCGAVNIGPPLRGIITALPAAALCSLKPSNVVPTAVIVLTTVGVRFLRDRDFTKEARRRILLTLLAIPALLIPWAILSYRTGGTFLFPVTLGNYRADYGLLPLSRPPLKDVLHTFAASLTGDPEDPQPTWLFMSIVLMVVQDAWLLVGFFLAPLVVMAMFAIVTPNAVLRDVLRYSYGFQHGAVVVACLHLVTGKFGARRLRSIWLVAFAAASLLLQIRFRWAVTGATQLGYLDGSWTKMKSAAPDSTEVFGRLQSSMEPGATVLAVVDSPQLFDFRRNRILMYDLPDAVSPAPHLSAADGSEAFARYLVGLGIRYVVTMRPGTSCCLYRRSMFEKILAEKNSLFEGFARHTLLALKVLDDLSTQRAVTAEAAGMVVIDLEHPPAASSQR